MNRALFYDPDQVGVEAMGERVSSVFSFRGGRGNGRAVFRIQEFMRFTGYHEIFQSLGNGNEHEMIF